MSETAKTITFVAVAAVVGLVAFLSRPSPPAPSAEGMVGKELFPEFTDPLAAASLEILEFDEDTASVRPFKVAQVGGRWSIPSHDNYPTDAQNQLADAAAGLMGLTALEVASDSPGDHQLFGVVDPEKATSGASGVGTLVTMKDKGDKTLLSLVIGKEVPDRDGLCYVRRTGQDPVYTVAVKTDKISTDFEDWIEEDLLKLSSWDIDKIEVRDYSVDVLAANPIDERGRLTLDYNDTGDPKWKLEEDLIFDDRVQDWVPNPQPMTDQEELDTEKLDEMRRALDDLKIVDVAKKPEGLSGDLRNLEGAETFLSNREAVLSLQDRGFYPVRWQGNLELVSNQGEIHAVTDEGARYILRFGNIAGTGKASKKDEGDADEGDADTDQGEAEEAEADEAGDSDGGVNRFLFVMAEFDPDAFEKPELEPLPEKPAEAATDEAEKKDAESEKNDEAPASEEASDAADTNSDEPEASETTQEGESKEGDEKSEALKEYEAEVERIEKENKRKQEEYDEKIKKGEEKVKELNDRFADWYYVISNDVYQKIHLSRSDVVKKKEKEEEEEKKDEAAEPGTTDEAAPAADTPAAETAEPPAEDAATEMPAEDKPDEETPAVQEAAQPQPGDTQPAEEKAPEKTPADDSAK